MKEIICNYAENDYAVQDAMICSGVGEQHQKNYGAVSPPLVKPVCLCSRAISNTVMICNTKLNVTSIPGA